MDTSGCDGKPSCCMITYEVNIRVKRTQIQLDEQTYRRLRDDAHAQHTSIAALVREALRDRLSVHTKKRRLQDFSFIGSGRSQQGDLQPISERHDEALTETRS